MNFSKLIVFAYQDFFASKGIATATLWKNPSLSRERFYLAKFLGKRKDLYAFDLNILKNYEKAIIVEPTMPHWAIEDMLAVNPKLDIKCWMTNIVADYGDWKIRDMQKLGVEVFSFDKEDCRKYRLTYNNNLYRYNIHSNTMKQKQQDCYFCGKDKGRLNFVLHMQQYFLEHGIKSLFKIICDKTTKQQNDLLPGVELLQDKISYNEIVEDINGSDCIIDILQDGQRGFTLRPLEALFYDKKLITNNPSVQDHDFYNPQNIFIIKEENFEGIEDFLNERYISVDNELKEQYSYKGWLEGFWKTGK